MFACVYSTNILKHVYCIIYLTGFLRTGVYVELVNCYKIHFRQLAYARITQEFLSQQSQHTCGIAFACLTHGPHSRETALGALELTAYSRAKQHCSEEVPKQDFNRIVIAISEYSVIIYSPPCLCKHSTEILNSTTVSAMIIIRNVS